MLDHALTKMLRLVTRTLIGLAEDICEMSRRVDERRRLSELFPLEWRDLGVHRVSRELSKWPWEQ
jgi:hypothetical protein